jgi:hypothetical protein
LLSDAQRIGDFSTTEIKPRPHSTHVKQVVAVSHLSCDGIRFR